MSLSIDAAAENKYGVIHDIRRRILELGNSNSSKICSRKLWRWWEIDFATFLSEVDRVFKLKIPLKQRGEWQTYLAENREAVERLSGQIHLAEQEIDTIVYRMFGLDGDEIAVLEHALTD